MRTFSAADGDIDFRIVTDAEALHQGIVESLRLVRGEWFLDTNAGLPRLSGRPVNLRLAIQAITARIRVRSEVTAVRDIEASVNSERTLRYRAFVDSIYGMVRIDTDVRILSG